MSFLGVSPGQGAIYALKKSLSEQAERDPVARYLSDHGEWLNGRRLPEGYEAGPLTQCHTNTLTACLENPALRLFTGMYSVGPRADYDLLWHFHSWAVDAEGLVVELTFPTHRVEGVSSFLADSGGMTAIPWIDPEHWAYVGIELDAEWTQAFFQHWGLPVFDKMSAEGYEKLVAAPYSKRPFQIV